MLVIGMLPLVVAAVAVEAVEVKTATTITAARIVTVVTITTAGKESAGIYTTAVPRTMTAIVDSTVAAEATSAGDR